METSISCNKRRASGNTPIWYVFIDESGLPYYDSRHPGPFALGAVITDDPERTGAIALTKESHTDYRPKYHISPGMGELKHSTSSRDVRMKVLSEIHDSGAYLAVAKHEIDPSGDYTIGNAFAIYAGTLSRLLIRIAEDGPEGIYRIRLEESEYIDQDLFESIVRSAFGNGGRRRLADVKAARLVESDLTSSIQTADMFVGEYREGIISGGDIPISNGRVIVANRKTRTIHRPRSFLGRILPQRQKMNRAGRRGLLLETSRLLQMADLSASSIGRSVLPPESADSTYFDVIGHGALRIEELGGCTQQPPSAPGSGTDSAYKKHRPRPFLGKFFRKGGRK